MGKSIRSKIRRLHRAEFRNTIGTVASEQNLEKVNAIMTENIEKSTLPCMNQLAEALDTTTEGQDAMDQDPVERAAHGGVNASIGIYEGKGENKVIINKKSKRKQKRGYRMKAIVNKTNAATRRTEKPRPRFHCSF